jgi:hypothetical protein
MALHVEGGTIRGLQRFISDVSWNEEHRLWNYHQLVAAEMGDPAGGGSRSQASARTPCVAAGQIARGMEHQAVRPDAGWPPHRRTTRVAPGWLWRLARRWGQNSPRSGAQLRTIWDVG